MQKEAAEVNVGIAPTDYRRFFSQREQFSEGQREKQFTSSSERQPQMEISYLFPLCLILQFGFLYRSHSSCSFPTGSCPLFDSVGNPERCELSEPAQAVAILGHSHPTEVFGRNGNGCNSGENMVRSLSRVVFHPISTKDVLFACGAYPVLELVLMSFDRTLYLPPPVLGC